MTYGEINNNPCTVIYNEEEHCWYYSSSILVFEGIANVIGQKIITPVNDYWYEFVITDGGNVIFANMQVLNLSSGTLFTYYEPLEEKLSYEGVEFDLSNKFSFSYDDVKHFESHTMFIEKLEAVNSANDVVERAKRLRNRSYKGAGLNPYSVCYDEKNDCWLYYEMVDLWETPLMYFVIDSNGQLLMFTFYIPKLS